MATKEEAQAVLAAAEAELATGISTPEELAARLSAAGCRGHRNSPDDCPVYHWFGQKLAVTGLPVGGMMTSSYIVFTWVERDLVSVALSAVIERFIDLFDNRDPARRNPFPELDLGKEETSDRGQE